MAPNPDYDYLNIFSNSFFDVDKPDNKPVKEIVQQVDVLLSSLIVKFGEVENELDYKDVGKKSEEIDYDKSLTNLVIMTLIRKIMEQLDAINILYSKCSFTQAQVILRSLIENVVGLEFILKDDTDLRASAYFMEHHYQEIQKANELFGDDSTLKSDISNADFEQGKKYLENKEKALNNLISKNTLFGQVDAMRKSVLATKKTKKITWYEIGGPKTFFQLMKEVNLGKYYSGIYGSLSLETHALNATTEITFDKGHNVLVNKIRSPRDGSSTFSLTCTFAVSALHKMYEYLEDGPEEKKEFLEYFNWFQERRNIVDSNLNMIVLNAD